MMEAVAPAAIVTPANPLIVPDAGVSVTGPAEASMTAIADPAGREAAAGTVTVPADVMTRLTSVGVIVVGAVDTRSVPAPLKAIGVNTGFWFNEPVLVHCQIAGTLLIGLTLMSKSPTLNACPASKVGMSAADVT